MSENIQSIVQMDDSTDVFKILDSASIITTIIEGKYYFMIVEPGKDPVAISVDDFVEQYITSQNFLTDAKDLIANRVNEQGTGFIVIDTFNPIGSITGDAVTLHYSNSRWVLNQRVGANSFTTPVSFSGELTVYVRSTNQIYTCYADGRTVLESSMVDHITTAQLDAFLTSTETIKTGVYVVDEYYIALVTLGGTAQLKIDGEGKLYRRVYPEQVWTEFTGGGGSGFSQAINGVVFDGTKDIHHYALCQSGPIEVAKNASLVGFKAITGAEVTVRFPNGNLKSNITLNINGTGDYGVRYNGSDASSVLINTNMYYRFLFDGTYYQLIGDYSESSGEFVKNGENDNPVDIITPFLTYNAREVSRIIPFLPGDENWAEEINTALKWDDGGTILQQSVRFHERNTNKFVFKVPLNVSGETFTFIPEMSSITLHLPASGIAISIPFTYSMYDDGVHVSVTWEYNYNTHEIKPIVQFFKNGDFVEIDYDLLGVVTFRYTQN